MSTANPNKNRRTQNEQGVKTTNSKLEVNREQAEGSREMGEASHQKTVRCTRAAAELKLSDGPASGGETVGGVEVLTVASGYRSC